jgi:hypothetical protein
MKRTGKWKKNMKMKTTTKSIMIRMKTMMMTSTMMGMSCQKMSTLKKRKRSNAP